MQGNMNFTASGDALITKKLPDKYPGSGAIRAFLQQGEMRITNIETTITDGDCYPSTFSGGTWLTAPEAVLQDLQDFGFTTYGIANNHMLDYSYPGLFETLDKLKAHGMPFTGAGRSLEEASAPVIVRTADSSAAFLAVTSTFDASARAGVKGPFLPARPGVNPLRHEEIYLVTPEHMAQVKEIAEACYVNVKNKRRYKTGYKLQPKDGIFEFKDMKFKESPVEGKTTVPSSKDLSRICETIRKLKQEIDYVVVMTHSHEMKDDSMESIDDFVMASAHAFIDAGADMILGGGCHQLKGIELYQGKPVFYSLGNFIYQNESVSVLPPDFMDKYKLPYTTTAQEALAARKSHAKNGGLQSKENYLSCLPFVHFANGRCTNLELLPIALGYEKTGDDRAIPYVAEEADRKTIYETLCRLSKPLGTELILDGNRIKVQL